MRYVACCYGPFEEVALGRESAVARDKAEGTGTKYLRAWVGAVQATCDAGWLRENAVETPPI